MIEGSPVLVIEELLPGGRESIRCTGSGLWGRRGTRGRGEGKGREGESVTHTAVTKHITCTCNAAIVAEVAGRRPRNLSPVIYLLISHLKTCIVHYANNVRMYPVTSRKGNVAQ